MGRREGRHSTAVGKGGVGAHNTGKPSHPRSGGAGSANNTTGRSRQAIGLG